MNFGYKQRGFRWGPYFDPSRSAMMVLAGPLEDDTAGQQEQHRHWHRHRPADRVAAAGGRERDLDFWPMGDIVGSFAAKQTEPAASPRVRSDIRAVVRPALQALTDALQDVHDSAGSTTDTTRDLASAGNGAQRTAPA